MTRQWIWWSLMTAALAAVIAFVAWHQRSGMYRFEVEGPTDRTPVAPVVDARIEDFDAGGPHRLAVLVTDRNSGWLGLVRAFKAHGIPFTITADTAKALTHRVVFVYPIISGRVLDGPALQALRAHVQSGGTLLTTFLAGGGMEDLFGITEAKEGRGRLEMTWAKAGAEPEDTVTRVSGKGDESMGTIGYAPANAEVAARFDDGTAAVLCRRAAGHACLLGVDVGAFAQRAMNGRGESIARHYVNNYEPSLDTLVRWIRDLYLQDEPMPWTLSTVPGDKALALVMSHDLDYGESVDKSDAFARALANRGVTGTFFVQTRYLRDANDAVFFDDKALPPLERVAARRMEIASHTVSHSRNMKRFPVGTGDESYPSYQPRASADGSVPTGTVMGEARVTKFLLQALVGTNVVSFRPGYLSYPQALPQVLEASGYRYSSSITANSTLTHLPFQLAYDRADAGLVPVYEFPVTIEDEEKPRLGERFGAADKALQSIARNQGIAVVLIHPNITDHKLRFEERLVDAWKPNAWIGSLAELGDWWRARDQVQADVVEHDGGWVLEARGTLAVRGLVVHAPKAAKKEVPLALEANSPVSVLLQ